MFQVNFDLYKHIVAQKYKETSALFSFAVDFTKSDYEK
mgnify:CR=1 FL=1